MGFIRRDMEVDDPHQGHSWQGTSLCSCMPVACPGLINTAAVEHDAQVLVLVVCERHTIAAYYVVDSESESSSSLLLWRWELDLRALVR